MTQKAEQKVRRQTKIYLNRLYKRQRKSVRGLNKNHNFHGWAKKENSSSLDFRRKSSRCVDILS
jgi:hypothetical protein